MTKEKNGNASYIMHSCIMLIIMIGFGFLPPVGNITELGMQILGVFLGSIYGWCFVDFIWPSILAMVVLGCTEYGTITSVFAAAMGDSIIMQLFFLFIFCAILDEIGITKYIATWCISRKMCEGHPWRLTAMIFLAAYLVGMINLYGGILLVWYIFYVICKETGYKKGDGYVSFVIVGVVLTITVGVFTMPFLPMSLMLYGMVCNVVGNVAMPSASWALTGLITIALTVLAYCLAGKFIFKIDLRKLADLPQEKFEAWRSEKMSSEQRAGLIVLAIFIVILLLPTFLPAGGLKTFLSNVGCLGASALGIVFFCCRRTKEGKKIVEFKNMVFNGVSWDILIMIMATMPISAAFESAEAGILSTILTNVVPFFTTLGGLGFVIITIIILNLLTQVVHNLVLMFAVMPTLCGVCMALGYDPIMYAFLAIMALTTALATPGASAQAALIYSNADWITAKDAFKFSIVGVVTTMLVLLCVIFPVSTFIF